MSMNRSGLQKFPLLLIFVVLGAGIVLILYQTRFGPGTTGDSVHYMMGAQNLLDGNGFSRTSGGGEIRPITMFAPFYSVVLAGLKLIGLDFFIGARLLNALLFGCSISLAGLLIYRYTNSYWAALIGSTFILLRNDVVFYFTHILTEALFVFLMLISIYTLVRYLDNRKAYLLVLSAVFVGLSTLTRYIGLCLAITGVASILLLSKATLKRRMVDSVIFSVVAFLPFIFWITRNAAVTGTTVNRAFIYHPISADLFQAYRAEITFWFVPIQLKFPHSLRRALMLLLMIPAPALFFIDDLKANFLKGGKSRRSFWTTPWVLGFVILSYVSILFLNLTFLDAISDFNTVSRYLVPVFILAVILFVLAFHWLLVRWERLRILQVGVLTIVLLLMGLYAQQTLTIIKDPLSNLGYTGLKHQRPETVEMLESVKRSAPIISNDPEMVYIFADRPAYLLPLKVDYHTTQEREDYDQQIEATREKLIQGGLIVIFSPMTEREFEVVELLDVELLDEFYGSAFYGYTEAMDE
jgi:hypothetical protein